MTEKNRSQIRPPNLGDTVALKEFRRVMDESGLTDVAKIDFDHTQTDDMIADVPVVRMQGPKPPISDQVLLHIHGGGYIVGSARIAANAERDGVDVRFDVSDGMWHCFHFDPALPEAQRACADIALFFRKHLKSSHL